jgi:N6-L-threonylcarbamoyladenine synthase
MIILGIETSCDETSASLVENGTRIISNVVSTSMNLHAKTGGIIPESAAREQMKFILPVIEKAITDGFKIKKTGYKNNIIMNFDRIDAIAVTIGPGLIGSLLVGVETAKTLAYITGKPIVGVNHIFAHIYANWLKDPIPQFPALALVVSGGHTELFLMKSHDSIKWIGGTLDDAAGECFDKTARLLDLGFPGGPAIADAALKSEIRNPKSEIRLPRPMNDDSFNFSFSGLKTAVLKEVNNLKKDSRFNENSVRILSHELQESITDVLVKKTLRAAQKFNVKSMLIGGGVAANKRLAEKFQTEIRNLKSEIQLFIPPPILCTDNAAYIASFAFFHFKPSPWQKITATPDLEVEV